MPQVLVTIGGRSYRLACGPGEEDHLAQLAQYVDSKITEMHSAFRDVGDQRVVVMAALSIADELFDAKRRNESHAADKAEAVEREVAARSAAEAQAAELHAAIEETTARVLALAENLNGAGED